MGEGGGGAWTTTQVGLGSKRESLRMGIVGGGGEGRYLSLKVSCKG